MKPCNKFEGETSMGRCSLLGVGVNRDLVCKMCQQHWPGDEPPATKDENLYLKQLVESKTVGQRLVNLGTSLLKVTGLASKKVIAERSQICNRCEMLVDTKVLGKSCQACGCSILKIQLEGMICPLGKW